MRVVVRRAEAIARAAIDGSKQRHDVATNRFVPSAEDSRLIRGNRRLAWALIGATERRYRPDNDGKLRASGVSSDPRNGKEAVDPIDPLPLTRGLSLRRVAKFLVADDRNVQALVEDPRLCLE